MKIFYTLLYAIYYSLRGYLKIPNSANSKKYYSKYALSIVVVLFVAFLPKKILANSITTGAVSGSFCVGVNITVPFTYVGTYTLFTAQLSTATGTFVTPGQTILQSVASNGTGSQSITVTIPRSIAPGTGYKIRIVSTSPPQAGTLTSAFTITANKWLGISTDWNASSNWCNGMVPDDSTNIVIQTAVNYPIITGKSYANSITINNGTSLMIGRGDTLSIHGDLVNNGGTLNVISGTIVMAGSAPQTIDGKEFVSSTIYNLVDSNTDVSAFTGLTISTDSVYITHQLSFGTDANAILTTNNLLVLVSNAISTANVGEIQEDGSGNAQSFIFGNITVQRYFEAHRRWRLVTAPVQSSGAPTINAAWQEGGQSIAGSVSDPNPGYGTDISGPAVGAFVSSTGYDQSSNNSASIARLVSANSWYSLPNTFLPVTTHQGYMLFVRGARDFPVYTGTSSTPATSTTLRTSGVLNTGRIVVPMTDTGFTIVGNPYAATINFNTIYNNSTSAVTSNSFSLWDPNIGSTANVASGTGGWVTLSWNGTSYDPSPDPHLFDGFDVNGDIQSGAAFAVNSTGVGNVQIDESAKDTGTDNHLYLFRPATVLSQPLIMLRTTLYATDESNTQIYLADGALNMFGSQYSNDVDWSKDVQKLFNFNEKVSILKDSQNLAIEKSALPQVGDTIYLNVSGLKQSQPYQFVLQTTNFIRSDIQAFFVDRYTHISTPILLGSASVNVNLTIDANANSYASDRFIIVFKAAPGSVDSTNIKAIAQNKSIDVQWEIVNQVNIKEYAVEKSVDGTDFVTVATMQATTDTSAYTYSWTDTSAIAGINYYRVYAVGNNLVKEDTSNVANAVLTTDTNAPISVVIPSLVKVYPNPVSNGIIYVDLTNLPAGNYGIRIISGTGRVLLSETKYHGSNDGPIAVPFGKNASAGIYMIEVVAPDGTKTKINVENQ
jgi:hypothetical protein